MWNKSTTALRLEEIDKNQLFQEKKDIRQCEISFFFLWGERDEGVSASITNIVIFPKKEWKMAK